ncbi:hypothetical protein U9R90_09545 [Streptomyces sp. E11-3]|uniref:hypothetical protein n=1 Tax=Streptomyces sp. E11-3 TaxID=3110112 RepID=UPI00397EC3DD
MFEYRQYEIRQAELIREADAQRLANQVRRPRRAAGGSAEHDPEGRVSDRSWRARFARAA